MKSWMGTQMRNLAGGLCPQNAVCPFNKYLLQHFEEQILQILKKNSKEHVDTEDAGNTIHAKMRYTFEICKHFQLFHTETSILMISAVNLNQMQQDDFHGNSCSKKAPIKGVAYGEQEDKGSKSLYK